MSLGEATKDEKTYNSRKPLWWRKLSGRATKGQKKAINFLAHYRLPKLLFGEQLDWSSIFSPSESLAAGATDTESSPPCNEIWFEIGFGNGENLLSLAQQHPNRNFVGADVHNPGLGMLCQRMRQAIQNQIYWSEYVPFTEDRSNRPVPTHQEAASETKTTTISPATLSDNTSEHAPTKSTQEHSPTNSNNNDDITTENNPTMHTPFSCPIYSNLRFYGGDGVKLLPYIPSNSIAAVLVTFPDPFPKVAQEEFRVFQKQTLIEIHRILLRQSTSVPPPQEPPTAAAAESHKGRLFLATDHEGHWEWCRETVRRVNEGHNTAMGAETTTRGFFKEVDVPDRTEWLPVISKYEQKGWNEGRQTYLSCWEVIE